MTDFTNLLAISGIVVIAIIAGGAITLLITGHMKNFLETIRANNTITILRKEKAAAQEQLSVIRRQNRLLKQEISQKEQEIELLKKTISQRDAAIDKLLEKLNERDKIIFDDKELIKRMESKFEDFNASVFKYLTVNLGANPEEICWNTSLTDPNEIK